MRRTSMAILYGVSFLLHASLGAGFAEIEPEQEPERIAISVIQAPKPKNNEEPPPPPPPPPPPKVVPKRKVAQPKAVDAPQPPAPVAAPAAANVPTFGIAMSGGVGLGGVAVPLGDSLHGSREPVKRVTQAKTLVEPKQKAESECAEPASKPKPREMQKPEYTEEARTAGIEGKVRVELTVSEQGQVLDVKVLEALGHGLDEAALRAVRAAVFEPALQCGKPVQATFVVAIRFSL